MPDANTTSYTVDVEYKRADGSTIAFRSVPVLPGCRIPTVGEIVRIETKTKFNYGAIIQNFRGFQAALLANTGRGNAQAVVVSSIIYSDPHTNSTDPGYATVKVRPISLFDINNPTNNASADTNEVRVLGMDTDIRNVIRVGTKGVLATDANDGLQYFLTNEMTFE